jgi:hypothetical protein
LSRVEAAAYLGISPSKFDEMRKDGRVGPAKLIDNRKVFDVRMLDEVFDALPRRATESTMTGRSPHDRASLQPHAPQASTRLH